MEIPQFGTESQQQYYYTPPQNNPKKKMFAMIGGLLLLIIALFFVLTSGGSSAGQQELRSSLQASADALGIIDEYENDLTIGQTKNDIALSQILIRGNFQKLNTLYNKTYKPKKKLSSSPKVDKKSQEVLDASKRNNTIDADIITALKPKIATAKKELKAAKGNFSGKATADIEKSVEDLTSIEEILNKPR